MKIKHFLIEGYCDGKNETECPCKGTLECGVYCFQCPRFSYTECPNEIAVSGNNGIIESEDDFVGFGGDMEPDNIEKREFYIDIWKRICQKKIDEAYREYKNILRFKEK